MLSYQKFHQMTTLKGETNDFGFGISEFNFYWRKLNNINRQTVIDLFENDILQEYHKEALLYAQTREHPGSILIPFIGLDKYQVLVQIVETLHPDAVFESNSENKTLKFLKAETKDVSFIGKIHPEYTHLNYDA